jgi:anti-sigma factor RsiW
MWNDGMTRGDFVPESNMHPPQWMLDLFADGALATREQVEVEAHIASCPHCAAEVDASRMVIGALGEMPRFEPSPNFAEAVMARVQIAPVPWEIRVRRWLPQTRRGWALAVGALTAPLAPVVVLLAWMLSHPMVTVSGLWYWGAGRIRDTAWNAVGGVFAAAVERGNVGWVPDLIAAAARISPVVLLAVIGTIAALTFFSGWSLNHLLRTPSGGATHAH